jgi:ABC-type cobalamin/Fe3+-siderophores transport system ATPase subunit
MGSDPPLLQLEGVDFAFGKRPILRSLSLTGSHGEFIALLGRNGEGKSTLLDILSSIRRPAAGKILIAGRPQQEWTVRELAKLISHLPQSIHADLPFAAEQLVAMGRYSHTDRWFESEIDHAAVARAMERTCCVGQRKRTFGTLSGGERQRVLLAACLAQDARILLLDEPSTFLDIEQQLHCFTLLQEEAAGGKLCIVVTHDLNLALTYCTRLVILTGGIIAHDLRTSDIDAKHSERDWLAVFSPRLQIAQKPDGAPWIFY